MRFYSANTPEQKRVKKLTGDINISEMFKNECEARGIAIYNAYNIQKRLLHEVEQEQLHGVKEVDDRLMELLDERSKRKLHTDMWTSFQMRTAHQEESYLQGQMKRHHCLQKTRLKFRLEQETEKNSLKMMNFRKQKC